MSSLLVLGAAFAGGVILNVMPCVLPVLTMKVFHVVEQAKEDPKVNRGHGIAYTAGILVLAVGFGIVVVSLKAAGERLAWGQQFQDPRLVAGLCALMFALGLNGLGVYEITIGMSDSGGGTGYRSSFFNGMVAAVMSTPCSAPMLGLALPVAFHPDTGSAMTVLIFTLIGFGLAAPFMLVSFVPAMARLLPKPGAWMDTFKKVMGFTLLAAAIWLFGVLQVQITTTGTQWFLAFLLALGFALWGQAHWGGFEHSDVRRWGAKIAAVGLTVAAGWFALDFTPLAKGQSANVAAVTSSNAGEIVVVKDGHINWVDFDPKVVDASLKRNQPVFLDFTAEWCGTCKANEKAFIEVDAVRGALEKTKILPVRVDFTNDNEIGDEWMRKLGRGGIPIYVVFMPDGTNILLPEVITSKMVTDMLEQASSKYPPDKFQSAGPTVPAKDAKVTATETGKQAANEVQ